MTRSILSLIKIPAWTVVWLVLLEAATRAVWQPSVVGAAAYAKTSASFGYGYDSLRPLCERQGAELVCVPTQYRPIPALQRLSADKDPSAIRIVTLGGSHGAGNRTPAYTHYALERLRTRCPALSWEAANFAVPGFGSARVRRVGEEALELEPDVLVIDFDGSNEYEDRRDLEYREQLHRGIWGILFRSQLVVLGRKYLSAEYTTPSTPERAPRGREAELLRDADVRDGWNEGLTRNYEALIERAHARGTEVVFVGLGLRRRRRNVAFEERHQLMWSLAEKHGVHVVDIGTLFQNLPTKKRVRLFQRDKRHYNARGHKIVARQLADTIERLTNAGELCR